MTASTDAMPAPEGGNGRLGEARLHPRSAYRETPKGPLDYELVHQHPSWLMAVAKDKRDRTGREYQDYFVQFTEHVRQHGVQQPIIAVRCGAAAQTVDGETRRLAALVAGIDSVPILIYQHDLSESQLVIAQLTANAQRKDFTGLELAAIYAELMKLNGWTQAELARNIQVNPAQVSKVLAISKRLCAEVQAMVAVGELPPRAAYAISRISDVALQIELAQKVRQGVLCVEGVEAQVAARLGGRPKKPRAIKLSHGGIAVTITGEVFGAWESFKSKMEEALKKLKRNGLPPNFLPDLI